MKPLFILLITFLLYPIISRFITGNWNPTFGGNLAMLAMLCFTAIGHFIYAKGMALMIPPVIPFKDSIVFLTGIMEIVLGIGLLFPAVRPYAGYFLIIFFILLLPANIYASMHSINYETAKFDGKGMSYLWQRIPLQLFFIGWVWYFSIN